MHLASNECPKPPGGSFQGDEVDFIRGQICPLNRDCAARFDRVVKHAGVIIDITGAGVSGNTGREVSRDLASQLDAFDDALKDDLRPANWTIRP